MQKTRTDREIWTKWRVALLDLDGTLYRGEDKIPGAEEFVQRLRKRGIQPVFVTNNSTRTPEQVVSKLKGFDIEAYPREIFNSSMAAAALVRSRLDKGSRVAAMGQEGMEEALLAEGLEPIMAGRSASKEVCSVDAVVMGLDMNFDYPALVWLCERISQVGSWILTNTDVRMPHGDAYLPGTGAVGRLVALATGIEPETAGKPNPGYLNFVLDRMGYSVQEAVMIGDNPVTDIAGASALEMDSILVESGVKYNAEEIRRMTAKLPEPAYTAESVRDFLPFLD